MRFPLADSPASGVGPRRGLTGIASAAWAPVGADAIKPPIWRGLVCGALRRSADHRATPPHLKSRGIKKYIRKELQCLR